jgi:hypothetical protein
MYSVYNTYFSCCFVCFSPCLTQHPSAADFYQNKAKLFKNSIHQYQYMSENFFSNICKYHEAMVEQRKQLQLNEIK